MEEDTTVCQTLLYQELTVEEGIGDSAGKGTAAEPDLRTNGRRVLTSDDCALPAAHGRAHTPNPQNAPRAEGKERRKQADSESAIKRAAIDACKTSSAF